MKGFEIMKKIMLILAAALLAMTVFTACSNGKCDECGKDKASMTAEAKQIGLKGELCQECMDRAVQLVK